MNEKITLEMLEEQLPDLIDAASGSWYHFIETLADLAKEQHDTTDSTRNKADLALLHDALSHLHSLLGPTTL